MKNPLSHIHANSVVERIKTNSILNPLLWLSAITAFIAWPSACWSTGNLQTFFAILGAIPIISAIVAYFIWMNKDPDRLQSEDYRLAQQRILHGTKEEGEFSIIEQTADHKPPVISFSESDQPDDPPSLHQSNPKNLESKGDV